MKRLLVVLIAFVAIIVFWSKVFASGPLGLDELSISLTSSERFEDSGATSEEVSSETSLFVRSMANEEILAADDLFVSAVSQSSYSSFVETIRSGAEYFSDSQRIWLLQAIAYELAIANENYSGGYRNISLEEMFEGLQAGYSESWCGNVATFVAQVARDAFGWGSDRIWLQTGASAVSNHTFNGVFYTDESGVSQIIWLDSGAAIPTGTTSYRNALSFRERYNGEIPLFQQWVGVPGAVLFPVTSRAEEVMLSATGWTDTDVRLSDLLAGEKKAGGRRLKINLSSDVKEIGYSSGSFGINYFSYKGQNDPYNSLKGLDGFRGDLRFEGENLSFSMGVTYLDYQVKGFDGSDDYNHRAIVLTPAVSVVNRQALNKSWEISYGAVLNAGGSYFFAESDSAEKKTGRLEVGAGTRLSYCPNDNKESFFLEIQDVIEGAVDDLESQKFQFQQKSFQTTLGGAYSLASAEIALADLNYGERFKAKLSLTYGGVTGEVKFINENSEWERFMPDSQEFSGALSYGWEVSQGTSAQLKIFGTVKEEQYLDATKTETNSVGVEIKVLWK